MRGNPATGRRVEAIYPPSPDNYVARQRNGLQRYARSYRPVKDPKTAPNGHLAVRQGRARGFSCAASITFRGAMHRDRAGQIGKQARAGSW
jgi:hypothetical protein